MASATPAFSAIGGHLPVHRRPAFQFLLRGPLARELAQGW